jgi:hypothetical protein
MLSETKQPSHVEWELLGLSMTVGYPFEISNYKKWGEWSRSWQCPY